MGEQQSQKRGVRSEAQKEAGTREEYAPTPASSPVAGAFGRDNRQSEKGVPRPKAKKK